MRRGLVAVLALATLVAPAPASAAIEFGDECLANTGEPGITLTQLQRASGSSLR